MSKEKLPVYTACSVSFLKHNDGFSGHLLLFSHTILEKTSKFFVLAHFYLNLKIGLLALLLCIKIVVRDESELENPLCDYHI